MCLYCTVSLIVCSAMKKILKIYDFLLDYSPNSLYISICYTTLMVIKSENFERNLIWQQ